MRAKKQRRLNLEEIEYLGFEVHESGENRYWVNDEQLHLLNKFRYDNNAFKITCEEKGIDPKTVPYYWQKDDKFSIFVRPDAVAQKDIPSILDDLFDKYKGYKPKYKSINLPIVTDPNLLVIDIADAHFGKLSSSYETGESYNINIAKQRVIEGIKGIVQKAKNFDLEKIMLVVGNDVLHYDNAQKTTTSGTRQDSDVMFHDMFNTALETFIEIIEWLMLQYKVDIIFNPSNHDYLGGWMFARALSCWFRGNENINIDDSIQHRKYYVYGNNLIGTSHGDGAKMQDMPLLMANEVPKLWADTTYRYVYLHHIHHKQVNKFQSGKDYIGVTVEYLRSPSASDSWHYRNGYVGAKKAIEGFIHNKEYGQVARLTHYF